ncbi:hypothetical protein POM88_011353 [Heracleum sosnowskyi]|uniref:Uncharacterized protein n=1 Tax=Heracleum sosnowskyi TaxID=360622 RepID=A0AAD8N1H9_9APIA|nr:hypothetical protein POM88_011353 [Heracleum sosnowskyi]
MINLKIPAGKNRSGGKLWAHLINQAYLLELVYIQTSNTLFGIRDALTLSKYGFVCRRRYFKNRLVLNHGSKLTYLLQLVQIQNICVTYLVEVLPVLEQIFYIQSWRIRESGSLILVCSIVHQPSLSKAQFFSAPRKMCCGVLGSLACLNPEPPLILEKTLGSFLHSDKFLPVLGLLQY